MDESLSNFIYKIAAFLMFIVATSIFISIYNNQRETLSFLDERLDTDKAITENQYDRVDCSVKGYEIISTLIIGSDIDIEVDGQRIDFIDIPNENFKKLGRDYSRLSKIEAYGDYKIDYSIDDSGVIKKIIYSLE